jgi:hypothetical protein
MHIKIGDSMIDTGRDKLGAFIGDNCRTGIQVEATRLEKSYASLREIP